MTLDFNIKNEIRSLTAFRFFAAFYVFLFHVNTRAPIFGDGLLGSFISEGAVGMTMFFVLSGFILSYVYTSVKIDLRQYFWNWFARIYPIYFLAAALALPWLAKDVLSEGAATNPFYAVAAGVILLVFGLLMIQAWLPQTFGFWNNGASWSISNEVFFYFVFLLVRTIISALVTRQLFIAFALLSILSSLVPLSAIVFSNAPKSFALFYALPFFRLAEFLCGIITYRLVTKVIWSRKLRFALLCIIILGVAHVALLGKTLPNYTLHNWIVIPAVSSALALLYDASTAGRGIFEGSVFVWLGRISYCFYSFQFHVLEGVRWIAPVKFIGEIGFALLAAVILLLVSAVAHHLVEEPARKLIRIRTSKATVATGFAA